jgi:predicted component of type VI protein secretion system
MLQVDLKVLEGRQQGKLIPLNVRQFLIGREQDCHLRPNSDLVSRHHCVFTIDDFTVRLRDLGSTNGTFVNGERIQGQVVLKPGDHVVVGKLSFEVVVRQAAAVKASAAVGKSGSGSSSSFPAEDLERGPESMETSLNVSDTMEFPAQMPPGDDTAVLPSFPATEHASQQVAPQPGYNMPSVPYGVPGYALPQGYGMPPGYPPGYSPGYPSQGYPSQGYPSQGYPAGYAPGYAMPNYLPMPPGYGMPQMMPTGPGYAMPQPAPEQSQPSVPEMQEVTLPDPETTGAKPLAPPPPPPPAAEGDAAAAVVSKKPSDAAADIIRSHRMRRPT